MARDPALARGVNVVDGKVTYEAVAEAHDLDFTPLEDVLPLSRRSTDAELGRVRLSPGRSAWARDLAHDERHAD